MDVGTVRVPMLLLAASDDEVIDPEPLFALTRLTEDTGVLSSVALRLDRDPLLLSTGFARPPSKLGETAFQWVSLPADFALYASMCR